MQRARDRWLRALVVVEDGRLAGPHVQTAPSTGKMANPFEFIQAVRAEAAKVTWPTRRETTITTVLVFVMVIVASIFFTVTDYVLHLVVGLVMGLGTGH
jgi:preprotein translocase subunit SecE